VTYRPQVALNAAIPAVLAQGDLNMLGTLHQREGDTADTSDSSADGLAGRAWTRVIDQDNTIRQRGTVSPRSEGWTSGEQLGVDLLASRSNRVGAYGGNLAWGSQVWGFASGIDNLSVGSLHGHTNYAGLYWTHRAESGWYSDAVLQQGWQHGTAQAAEGGSNDIHGHSTVASLEMGKPFKLAERWAVEPQAQVIVGKQHLDSQSIAAADIDQDLDTNVTGRLGFRVTGDFQTNQGRLQPYGRFNVWHGFSGTNDMSVGGPAGDTSIGTEHGYTSGELALGGTWTLNRRVRLYGEAGHMFPMGGSQRVSAEHTISAGILVAW
jgi:outer membrane autotransporter protein